MIWEKCQDNNNPHISKELHKILQYLTIHVNLSQLLKQALRSAFKVDAKVSDHIVLIFIVSYCHFYGHPYQKKDKLAMYRKPINLPVMLQHGCFMSLMTEYVFLGKSVLNATGS